MTDEELIDQALALLIRRGEVEVGKNENGEEVYRLTEHGQRVADAIADATTVKPKAQA